MNVKTKKTYQIGLSDKFIIRYFTIKDSIGLISGTIYDLDKDGNLANQYLLAGVYAGAEKSRWGEPLFCGLRTPYNNINLGEFQIMNFGYSLFSDDGRILTLDTWSGVLYEHSLAGEHIFTRTLNPEINLCPQRPVPYSKLDSILISGCSSYFPYVATVGIIGNYEIFMAMRNVTNPPVFLDFWDISKRKFLGSINIGNATLFAVHDSSI